MTRADENSREPSRHLHPLRAVLRKLQYFVREIERNIRHRFHVAGHSMWLNSLLPTTYHDLTVDRLNVPQSPSLVFNISSYGFLFLI